MIRIRSLVIFLFIFLPVLCFGQIYGYINIFVSGPIAIVVENSQGQRAGYDPRTDMYYEEIKGFAYGPAGMGSEIPGEPSLDGWDFTSSESIKKSFNETYRLSIIGKKAGIYEISAGMSQTLDKGEGFEFEGEIDSLEVKEYEFFYTTDTTKSLYFRECQFPAGNQ
ncbi:MAG: hypothetical protein P8184_19145 [Calditrichia bacterium]